MSHKLTHEFWTLRLDCEKCLQIKPCILNWFWLMILTHFQPINNIKTVTLVYNYWDVTFSFCFHLKSHPIYLRINNFFQKLQSLLKYKKHFCIILMIKYRRFYDKEQVNSTNNHLLYHSLLGISSTNKSGITLYCKNSST